MAEKSGKPIIGRLASVGFGFLSSAAGLAVAGSIGCRSQTIAPQIPPPHFVTLTLASPACVSQVPVGSAAGSAWAAVAARSDARNRTEEEVSLRTMHAPKKA